VSFTGAKVRIVFDVCKFFYEHFLTIFSAMACNKFC